jgi:release factor glutamine methyltransferase
MLSVLDLWREVETQFRDAGLDDVSLEAQILIGHVVGFRGARFLAELRREVSAAQCRVVRRYVRARVSGMPLGYVLGEWEFAGSTYYVGPGVLIPRPETELVLEEAVSLVVAQGWDKREGFLILEFGVGSGILSIELAKRFPSAMVMGWEKSVRAARYARRNIAVHDVPVQLQVGDFFKTDFETILQTYSCVLVVGNPPYICRDVIPGLMREVREFEPNMALDGGADGLAIYRRLVRLVSGFQSDVMMVLEIGFDQGHRCRRLFEGADFDRVCVIPDLANLDRVVTGLRLE